MLGKQQKATSPMEPHLACGQQWVLKSPATLPRLPPSSVCGTPACACAAGDFRRGLTGDRLFHEKPGHRRLAEELEGSES